MAATGGRLSVNLTGNDETHAKLSVKSSMPFCNVFACYLLSKCIKIIKMVSCAHVSLVRCKFMALDSECPHCDGNRCQGGEFSAVALANCTKSLVLGESSHVTENRYKVKTYENVWNVKHRQTVWLQELWCPGQAKPVNSCHNSLSIYWIHGGARMDLQHSISLSCAPSHLELMSPGFG